MNGKYAKVAKIRFKTTLERHCLSKVVLNLKITHMFLTFNV
jgi:hypothetical protein